MKEHAGFAPDPDALAEGQGPASLEGERRPHIAGLVVPQTQRLAMPVQRLEALSLRRLIGAPGRMVPVRITTSSAAASAPSNDR